MTSNAELIESAKIAFCASLMNANAGMRWLDHDSMDEMIEAAWVGFEDAVGPRVTALEEQITVLSEALATYDCGPQCGYLNGKLSIEGRCPRDFEGSCGKKARAALSQVRGK